MAENQTALNHEDIAELLKALEALFGKPADDSMVTLLLGTMLSTSKEQAAERMAPKPELPTATIFGMELPIIADLGDGWFLVAHPNGAAIATTKFLAVLWTDCVDSGLPESVQAFEKLAWPLVRDQFYENESGEVK